LGSSGQHRSSAMVTAETPMYAFLQSEKIELCDCECQKPGFPETFSIITSSTKEQSPPDGHGLHWPVVV